MKNSSISWQPASWQSAWETASSSRLWILTLLGLGAGSSVIYAHAPLVAFAVIAGTTLKPHKAITLIVTVWLINQLYGYWLRHFPLTLEALGWGVLMGIGAVLIALIATLRPRFSKVSRARHLLWTILAAAGGFVLFEGLILLALQTSDHGLDSATLLKLFSKEMLWTAAMALLYWVLIELNPSYSRSRHLRSLPH